MIHLLNALVILVCVGFFATLALPSRAPARVRRNREDRRS